MSMAWKPEVDLEEGLRRTVGWYLEHQDWIESVITGEYLEYYQRIYGEGQGKRNEALPEYLTLLIETYLEEKGHLCHALRRWTL